MFNFMPLLTTFTMYSASDIKRHKLKNYLIREAFLFCLTFVMSFMGVAYITFLATGIYLIAITLGILVGGAIVAMEQKISKNLHLALDHEKKKAMRAIASRVAIVVIMSFFTANGIMQILMHETVSDLLQDEVLDSKIRIAQRYDEQLKKNLSPIKSIEDDLLFLNATLQSELAGDKRDFIRDKWVFTTSGRAGNGHLAKTLNGLIDNAKNDLDRVKKIHLPIQQELLNEKKVKMSNQEVQGLDYMKTARLLHAYVMSDMNNLFYYVLLHLLIIGLELGAFLTKISSPANAIDVEERIARFKMQEEEIMKVKSLKFLIQENGKAHFENEYTNGSMKLLADVELQLMSESEFSNILDRYIQILQKVKTTNVDSANLDLTQLRVEKIEGKIRELISEFYGDIDLEDILKEYGSESLNNNLVNIES